MVTLELNIVELGISLTQPIVHVDGRGLCIRRSDVQMLHHDSRRLIARIAHDHFHCLLAVLHGPQSGRPHQERQEWWDSTPDIVMELAGELPVFLLLDANAKTGPLHPPFVFEHSDIVSGNANFFLNLLDGLSLGLPSTTSVHDGEHSTWISPDGLQN